MVFKNYYIARIAFEMYSVASMPFVMGDFSSFFMTAEIPNLNYRLYSPLMNARYCWYRTDARRMCDNINVGINISVV